MCPSSVAKLSGIATGHAQCTFTIVLIVLDNCKFALCMTCCFATVHLVVNKISLREMSRENNCMVMKYYSLILWRNGAAKV